MMNYNIKTAVNIIKDEMNRPNELILHEGDFVDAQTQLSDTQVKQIFMVLSQASVYKKIQGNLDGYTSSIKTDMIKETIRLNEIDPFGDIAKLKDDFMAKFGNKGAKMAQVARNTSQNIWKKWENDSIEGGISSTVESLSKWINQKGVDIDLIDVAFRAIGIPNIKSVLRQTTKTEILSLDQWMKENGVTNTTLNGNILKDYLLDVNVKEEDIPDILKNVGIKNMGTLISKKQNMANKLKKMLSTYTPPEDTDEPSISSTPNGDWSANDLYEYIIKNYEVDDDEISKTFRDLGIKTVDEEMGDERVRKILHTVSGKEKNMFTMNEPTIGSKEAIDQTQKIMKDAGVSVGAAQKVGREVVNSGNYANMNELQKLGIAVLTARNKI